MLPAAEWLRLTFNMWDYNELTATLKNRSKALEKLESWIKDPDNYRSREWFDKNQWRMSKKNNFIRTVGECNLTVFHWNKGWKYAYKDAFSTEFSSAVEAITENYFEYRHLIND